MDMNLKDIVKYNVKNLKENVDYYRINYPNKIKLGGGFLLASLIFSALSTIIKYDPNAFNINPMDPESTVSILNYVKYGFSESFRRAAIASSIVSVVGAYLSDK